jgi:hydrogenase nickel incorporation protein HypA/HybF
VHEMSIASAIAATAERHAAGRRVLSVDVRVGHLRQVVVDSLHFAFGIVTRETVLDGARLVVEVVPARLCCTECAHEWEVAMPAFRCPECLAADVTVLSGEELEVESIEVEQEEKACTA